MRGGFSAGAMRALKGAPGAAGAAGPQGATGPQGPKGDAGADGAAGAPGQDAFADVGVATNTGSGTTLSQSFVDVPTMSTTVTVPAGRTATVVANFSAEATCSGGSTSPNDDCLVRVLLDDVEMSPASGTDATFKSWGGSSDDHHALVRSRSGVGAGAHTVKVQWAVGVQDPSTPPTFRLDDMSLTALAIED